MGLKTRSSRNGQGRLSSNFMRLGLPRISSPFIRPVKQSTRLPVRLPLIPSLLILLNPSTQQSINFSEWHHPKCQGAYTSSKSLFSPYHESMSVQYSSNKLKGTL